MVNWIAAVATAAMDAVSGLFLDALGTDMLVMEQYFPFVTTAFEIMQYLAWCILFLITVWQLFKTFGGPITEAENPLHLIVRSALFAFLIGYAKPIFMITLDIARAPYTALMNASMDPGEFTFAGIENVLVSGLITTLAIASVVGQLLIAILLLILGWNYFKTLLLVVERYIIVGVLCYTSPLAFARGGSKATEKVFQSWCRMVGAQLLLLVMNVWFLRAFNSSVGHFIANGGALTSGQGNIFLWIFCALAFLKIAQKFDSILSSLGLNLAQTCGHMGMEMLMASRVLTGFGGKASRTEGSMFGAGSNMMSGTALTSDSISSVASRHPSVSGSIGGNIADRSLANYMPHLSGTKVNGTAISGGQISTTATAPNGKEASVRMYNSSMYDKPDTPHSVVKAADGSTWYQTASGEGMSSFYSPAQNFTGDVSEAAQVKAAFPDVEDGTALRSVDDGVIEATNPDGSNSMWYNSGIYQEPEAPHETISSADGVSWYAMRPNADPNFETGDAEINTDMPSSSGETVHVESSGVKMSGITSDSDGAADTSVIGASGTSEIASHNIGSYQETSAPQASSPLSIGGMNEFNKAQFQQFMPAYEQQISSVDATRQSDGVFEVRHEDGTGTAFYDGTKFKTPRGEHQVYEDSNGGSWYAVQGTPTVERRPMYENGKAVREGSELKTVNVEGIKYKTTPEKFSQPQKRDANENRPPRKKQ
jgi:hypothetical protein